MCGTYRYTPLVAVTISLTEEERCAMTDMARAGDTDAILQSLQSSLLLKLATAATKALYGGKVPLTEMALQRPGPNNIAPLDLSMSVTFTPAMPSQPHINFKPGLDYDSNQSQ